MPAICIATAIALTSVTAPAASAVTSSVVSTVTPTRLVQSSGNLYWTSNQTGPAGTVVSRIHRTSKAAIAGSERVLYETKHTGGIQFAGITWSKVGQTWWGFVVINNPVSKTTQIKRFSLAADEDHLAMKTLANSPAYAGTRDIAADNNFVYWADAGGIHRVSVNGGPRTTIVTGTGISMLTLDSGYLYYVAAERQVRRVAPAATPVNAPVTVIAAAAPILGLDVHNSKVFWSESNATVRSQVVFSTYTRTTYVTGLPQFRGGSVFTDGTRLLYTTCNTQVANACSVSVHTASSTHIFGGLSAVRDLQGDTVAAFWGGPQGTIRLTY